MESDEVFLLLPPEVQELLDDNGLDLVEELRRQGLDVGRGHRADPATQGQGQSRDVVLVILASAALVTAISAGVCRVLDAVGRNKSFVAEEVTLAPVVGPDGDVVRSADGEPVLYWEKRHTLVQAEPRSSSDSVELSGLGIRIATTSTSTPGAGTPR